MRRRSLGCLRENEGLDDSVGNTRNVGRHGGNDRPALEKELEGISATTKGGLGYSGRSVIIS